MSKYTLELRLLNNTPSKVFDFEYDFYTTNTDIKNKFEQKFIDEYFFNEIGFETIGRFKQRLKNRLNKLMPYYKQLYETELRCNDIDFMVNKNLVETYVREVIGSNNSNSDLTVNDLGENNNLESNIENGNASLTLESGSLTNVSKSTLDNSTTSTNIVDNTSNQNESSTFTSKGNIGVNSDADMLQKWREILINIDEQIINECNDLFMQIY